MKTASANYASSIIKEAIRNIIRSEDDFRYILNKVKYLKELEEPYFDTSKILEQLSGRYSIGIIANQSFGTEERLKRYGLWNYLDLCLSSAEIGIEKPVPEIFLMALEKAKCKPENAVMIGDRLDNDIYPAKKLGFKTVHILRGFGKFQIPKSKEYEPDFTITELAELLEIFSGKRYFT